MALQLMKLAIVGSTTVEVQPEVERFFYVNPAVVTSGDTLSIDAAAFFDDTGTAVVELPALASNNSYYNVYVNGVLQMQGITTYTPGATGVGSVDVEAAGSDILASSPIVVEVVNYVPTSTTVIET